MSYTPYEHVNHVLQPPARSLPKSFEEKRLPRVAQNFGFIDVCDGVNNLGDLDIKTPEEEQICETRYTNNLRELAQDQEPLPPELSNALHVKAIAGALTVRELAVLAFNFLDDENLRTTILPFLKRPNNMTQTLRHAELFGYISGTQLKKAVDYEGVPQARGSFVYGGTNFTGKVPYKNKKSFPEALFYAYTVMRGVDPLEVPDAQQQLFSPESVLNQHTAKYGGRQDFDRSNTEAIRAEITDVYQAEFENKIFYPNPIQALEAVYPYAQLAWNTHEKTLQTGSGQTFFLCTGVNITSEKPGYTGGKWTDRYRVQTLGQHPTAAQRAAARVILQHIGATNPQLLATSE